MYIHELSASALTDAALFAIERQMNDNQWHTYKLSGSDLKSALTLAGFITTTSDTLVYYYTKSQTYSKTEVNALIESVKNSRFEKVETLPVTGESNVIYLVPRSEEEPNNVYDEYIWLDEAWEKIGSTDIDLSGYVTTQALNTILADYMTTSAFNTAIANYYNKSEINSQMAAKVDKEAGKGLSTNDYTSVEKDKLAGISPSAKKVSASSINGNIQIDEVETTVYDDTALDSRVDVVEQDLSTDTRTVEGNPLNFTTLTAQKAKETVISLAPIQDLHGYDYPWPGGGGKNLYIGSPSFDGYNNIEQYQLATEKYNGHDVIYKNKAWDGVNYPIEIKAGVTYTFSAMVKLSASGSVWGYTKNNTSLGTVAINANTWTKVSFTYTPSSDETSNFRIETNNNSTTIYLSEFQLEIGSTATSYAPYSNICPIDGRTETSLVGRGVNELNIYGNYVMRTAVPGTISVQNESVTVKSNNSSLTYFGFIVPAIIDESYTISYIVTGSKIKIAQLDEPITEITSEYGDVIDSGSSFIATKPYILVNLFAYNTAITYQNVQLELGSSPTTYEPYIPSNNLTIQFGEKVYGAKVELEKGTVTVDTEIADLGTLGWSKQTSVDIIRFQANLSNSKGSGNNSIAGYLLCSQYKNESWLTTATTNANGTIAIVGAGGIIAVQDNSYSDATTFTTAMSGVQLCYELATPRTITLTQNEISLLEGVNVISTDADGIKLTYRDGKVATLGDLDGLVKKIADCEDVEITDLQASDVLVWDATAEKWKNQQSTSMVVYDDTEQVIGTWFGETLYQKTIVTQNTTKNAEVTIDVSSLNIDTCVNIFGTYSRIAAVETPSIVIINVFNDLQAPNNGYYSYLKYTVSTKLISYKIQFGESYDSTDKQTITIQYTKTTPTLLMQSTEESTPADESTDENR